MDLPLKFSNNYAMIYHQQNYRVINNSQYGFKAKTSTSHALADATHYTMSNLDSDFIVFTC